MIEEELFHRALEKPTLAEQLAFLDQACADEPELRQRVERLLRSHWHEDSFLQAGVTTDQPLAERPGTVIGPYKLLEPIGEGGMGTVWMAQQTEPVKRLVAVKLIKAGMDSKQVIARFEAERQALALMDHANIAKVLDGGTTKGEPGGVSPGRPYFVMDLVKGVPITRYCDEHHLTPRQRLELFLPVCLAVQHAHQKGIIHRDLKPSNVLVALYDGKPVPKVIDFGVAKAVGQSLTEKTLVTGFGVIVGTLEYMSPEQAEINQLDIDTRSDIYSLGVLLYELLTGSPPFTRLELEKAGMLEMLRVIREQEPSKPSTKLSTAERLPTLAANRGTEPAKLTKLVRGELDWIVMKALEKDRNRRYETANGFALDVQRYLADEPVQACPPSAWYRLRKFARRNKVTLVMASVIGVTLLLTVGGLGWAMRDREAQRARTAAAVNQFLDRAESLYAAAKLSEALVEVQQARGVFEAGGGDEGLERRVRQWLTDLHTAAKFEELRRQHPDISEWDRVYADYSQVFREYGIDVDALSVEEASARIAGSRIMFELTVALDTWAWRLQIGPQGRERVGWKRLREIQRAADPDPWRQRLHRAADVRDLKALHELAAEADVARLPIRTLALLGTTMTWSGDPEAAVALLRKVQRQHPGSFLTNEVLARCLTYLKPPPWDEVVEFRRAALALNPKSASAHAALGDALLQKGRPGEAIDAYREAIRLDPTSPHPHGVSGWIHLKTGEFVKAELAFREQIRLQPALSAGHFGLGRALLEQKKFADAEPALREAFRLDPPHPSAGQLLVQALIAQGKTAEAEAAARDSVISLTKAVELKPDSWESWHRRGLAFGNLGQWEKAVSDQTRAIELKPDHPWSWHHRGLGHSRLNQWDKAVADYSKAIELKPDYWQAYHDRGLSMSKLGQWDKVIADQSKALELNPKHWWSWARRGDGYSALKQWDKAVADYTQAIRLGATEARVWVAKADAHAQLKQPEKAIAELRQAVAKGFRDAQQLRNGAPWTELRDREDFQQLVKELEARKK